LSSGDRAEVNWDGLWWWPRPDGVLQIQPLSRLAKNPELLAPYQVSSPLWQTKSHLDGAAVGSAHRRGGRRRRRLTVGQRRRRGLAADGPAHRRRDPRTGSVVAGPHGRRKHNQRPPDADRVNIIELRRPMSPPREQDGSSSERQYHHRWWVGGHWRQQACGPNHADRRPKWIAPYVKGPEGTPLTKDRVHVWRR
jgi:hypothetical protein